MQSCWHPFLGGKPIPLKTVCKKKAKKWQICPTFLMRVFPVLLTP